MARRGNNGKQKQADKKARDPWLDAGFRWNSLNIRGCFLEPTERLELSTC